MKKIYLIILAVAFNVIAMAQIPTNGLVGYWPFNGNANDESGNGNNGTVYSATLATDYWGQANKAYSFNGTSSYIRVYDNSMLNPQTFTISCWISKLGYGQGFYDGIVSKYDGNSGYLIALNGESLVDTNNIGYWIRENSLNFKLMESDNPIINSNWYNIVATFDQGVMKMYINNQIQSATVTNAILTDNGYHLFFGKYANSFFNGKIDDIRIYNRVLTPSEITELFKENTCTDSTYTVTTEHNVSNSDFSVISPKTYLEGIDSLITVYGGCDSILHKYTKYIYSPNYYTDTTFITVTDTLIINAILSGVSPVTINTIKVYPNPTNDHIIINYGNYSSMIGYNLKIYNSTGQQVYTESITNQQTTVDLNTWSGNGLYFVKLYDNQSNLIEVRKIVLQ